MTLLDGKKVSNDIKQDLKQKVQQLTKKYQVIPSIAIVKIGDNSASDIYVRNKIRDAQDVGINTVFIEKTDDISEKQLLSLIDELNKDEFIHGIIVQLPLPDHINEQAVIDAIDPSKDIDGFCTVNKGRLFSFMPTLAPATPLGIIKLLEAYKIDVTGKEAVVVGRSNIVGKPMGIMLLSLGATVTIAHRYTTDLKKITKEADILVVAVGKKGLITADMVKPGAVVIDVGINRENKKIYGDVDFDEVSKIASYITPVPGGVGPLTIAALLSNSVQAYEEAIKKR